MALHICHVMNSPKKVNLSPSLIILVYVIVARDKFDFIGIIHKLTLRYIRLLFVNQYI